MTGPCEHCGLADKSRWTSACLYKGDFPSRRAFQLSTSDPPCAGDAYDEGQRELAAARRHSAISFWLAAGAVAGVAALVWMV